MSKLHLKVRARMSTKAPRGRMAIENLGFLWHLDQRMPKFQQKISAKIPQVRQYDQGGLQSPITNVVQITLKVNAHSR
jgi:hypothetical protein